MSAKAIQAPLHPTGLPLPVNGLQGRGDWWTVGDTVGHPDRARLRANRFCRLVIDDADPK